MIIPVFVESVMITQTQMSYCLFSNIDLPNEQGRLEILNIHTKIMREANKMSTDVDLKQVAEVTKNYSGAELAGVIRTASANALYSSLDDNDINTIINNVLNTPARQLK